MEPVASIVVPCYNKEKYIGEMLRSIFCQTWSKIELILVNDGSTDSTRQIIREWEPQLVSRGYSVIIIDQDNKGLPGAVRCGFQYVTGDCVCTIDSDDMLDPEYVGDMMRFLEKNPEFEWVACDFEAFDGTDEEVYAYNKPRKYLPTSPNMLENFLFGRFYVNVWYYMVRTTYLKQCHVVENFSVEPRRCQEPQFVIPLASGGGKLGYISKKLYKHRYSSKDLSWKSTFDIFYKARNDTHQLCVQSIMGLPIVTQKKERLIMISELFRLKTILCYIVSHRVGLDNWAALTSELADCVNAAFFPSPTLVPSQLTVENIHSCFSAIESVIFGENQNLAQGLNLPHSINTDQIIGWGALGKMGQRLIPQLIGTVIEPSILWDQMAQKDATSFGIPVVAPSFDCIGANHVFLIFPNKDVIVNEMIEMLNKNGGKYYILYDEIVQYLAAKDFYSIYQSEFLITGE